MKKAVSVARRLLGLVLVLFAIDHFVAFLPHREVGAEGAAFLAALGETGYMLPLVHGIELLAGLCLLGGLFAPLALILVGPIVVNIFFFHLFLDPGGLIVAVPLLLLDAFLVWGYRYHFEELLQVKAQVW